MRIQQELEIGLWMDRKLGHVVMMGKLSVGIQELGAVYCISTSLEFRADCRILTPDTDTSEYTALIVSKDFLAVASLQTLFLLAHQSGDILSQVTAHTTPIRTIRFSPRLDVLATAAVGDRFIAVFSTEDNKLERIGSLTCTHDVQNFIIQDEILLAITVLGTLEVFHSFHANFEPGKKGGLTKAPSAEISLTTSHNAPIEIVDVVPRGNETMISWLEGVKIGFERIDIQSISGKVELDIQTRQEQTQQQVLFLQDSRLTHRHQSHTTNPRQQST